MISVFLYHGYLLEKLNDTHVVFIPKKKKDSPKLMITGQLIYVLSYKFMSKLLTNRLKIFCQRLSLRYKVFFFSRGKFMTIFLLYMKFSLFFTEK